MCNTACSQSDELSYHSPELLGQPECMQLQQAILQTLPVLHPWGHCIVGFSFILASQKIPRALLMQCFWQDSKPLGYQINSWRLLRRDSSCSGSWSGMLIPLFLAPPPPSAPHRSYYRTPRRQGSNGVCCVSLFLLEISHLREHIPVYSVPQVKAVTAEIT